MWTFQQITFVNNDGFPPLFATKQSNNLTLQRSNFRIHPGVLGLTISKLQDRISYLKELGMTTEDISRAVSISPALLTYSLKNRIPDYIEYFRQFNLPRDKVIKMLIKTPTMIGLSTVKNSLFYLPEEKALSFIARSFIFLKLF